MNRISPKAMALLTAGGLLALTGCSTGAAGESPSEESSSNDTVTVEHVQGTTEVPKNPETVISMDLGVVDSFEALGKEVDGLPKLASLPDEFEKYQDEKYVNAGGMKEPDMEAISAANPDLIIISGRTADFYDQFSEIAPTVDLTMDQKDPVASFKKQSETIGQILGKESEVEDKLADVDQQISDTKQAAADAGSAMFLMTNAGEVNAYGPGSRFGNIIFDTLGLEPAGDVQSEGSHGESLSFEAISEANPDRLYVIDRDVAVGQGESGQAAQQVLDNDLVNQTTAATKDQITYLDPSAWYIVGPGLNNFPAMITEVQDSLT